MEYLHLHANVHFVPGQPHGALYDLRGGRVRKTPPVFEAVLSAFSEQPLSTVLADFFGGDKVLLKRYVDFLVGGDWAYLTPSPELFPHPDSNWDSPFSLSTAIVAYDFCKPFELRPLLKELSSVGCRHLELQLYNFCCTDEAGTAWRDIGTLLSKCEFRRGTLVLGEDKGAGKARPEAIHRLLTNWPRFGTIVVLGQQQREDVELYGRNYHLRRFSDLKEYATTTWEHHPSAHFVGSAYFREARSANPYFNRRIAVDRGGYFRNDLLYGGAETFGCIGERSVVEVLKDEGFIARWTARPDVITCVKNNPLRYCLRYDRALVKSPVAGEWSFAKA